MNRMSTLLNSIDELEASMWLEIFENLPDDAFNGHYSEPSQQVIQFLKQYAKCHALLGNNAIALN